MAVVLVVEDDVEIRATMRLALEDDGHTVLEAQNGLDALALLRSHREPMVVLLDLLLPQLSGDAVLKQVVADSELAARHSYVLLTAAHQSFPPPFASMLKQLGVPILHKPFDLDTLFETVAQAAQHVGA